MHRKNPISVLVYNTLFPSPTPTDPPSFSAHLSKNLVGEVRIETANFYGSLDTIEARYPGLNYAHAPHRKRLGRFPHHRRLFDAFDRLGLTESEIQGFCRWEGTLWARERYERDEGVRVVDTTAMEIGEWVDNRRVRNAATGGREGGRGINVKTDIEVEIERVPAAAQHEDGAQGQDAHMMLDPSLSRSHSRSSTPPLSSLSHQHQLHHHHHQHQHTDSDPLPSSIGYALNARLLHAAALRDSGANIPVPVPTAMDPEWEAYWKEAQERGELNVDATREALRTMAGQLALVGVEAQALAAAREAREGAGAAAAAAGAAGVSEEGRGGAA